MHWLITYKTGNISLFGAITMLYDHFCILPALYLKGNMVTALGFMGTNRCKVSVNKTQAVLKKKRNFMQSKSVSKFSDLDEKIVVSKVASK